MSIVFFEGFNISNSDLRRLDTAYWSAPESDITFGSGRTNNAIYLRSTPYDSGRAANKRLDLSNFISPLTSNNAFGLGFYVTEIKENESKLVSFHNGSSDLLEINVITTSYNSTTSLGLEVRQNGSQLKVYDFKSPIGYTYSIQNAFFLNGWRVAFNQGVYLEFFIDPKNTNTIRIRANGLDMYNNDSVVSTAISGFTNIDKISFYGSHDNGSNSVNTSNRMYDDLYLNGGNSISDTLLGSNTKIYRVGPESRTSTDQWYSLSGDNAPWFNDPSYNSNGDVSNNDGDNGYIYTAVSGNTSLFNITNLPAGNTVPSGVGGIKVINTARKLTQDSSFVNVYASGNGQTITEFGPQHQLTQASYNYHNHFAFQNPQTNTNWTITDINNMQLGVRKL